VAQEITSVAVLLTPFILAEISGRFHYQTVRRTANSRHYYGIHPERYALPMFIHALLKNFPAQSEFCDSLLLRPQPD
jgi:hypothetical protein